MALVCSACCSLVCGAAGLLVLACWLWSVVRTSPNHCPWSWAQLRWSAAGPGRRGLLLLWIVSYVLYYCWPAGVGFRPTLPQRAMNALANLSSGKAFKRAQTSSYYILDPLSSLQLGAWSFFNFWAKSPRYLYLSSISDLTQDPLSGRIVFDRHRARPSDPGSSFRTNLKQ